MYERAENFSDRKIKKEKIDGKIYLMASPCLEHREIQGNLSITFNDYFKKNKRRCRAIFDHDLYIDESNTIEPDIKILCRKTRDDDIPVIIEVLSKSTRERDLGIWASKWKNTRTSA